MIIEQLKDYLNNNQNIKGLYITFVSKKYNISPKESLGICVDLVKQGVLSIELELVCPECGITKTTISTLDELTYIDNCSFCGMMQEGFTTDDIQIYYRVNR